MNRTACLLLLISQTVCGQLPAWPLLIHYEGRCIEKIAMPVGGIGTGTIQTNSSWKSGYGCREYY